MRDNGLLPLPMQPCPLGTDPIHGREVLLSTAGTLVCVCVRMRVWEVNRILDNMSWAVVKNV